jgi:hypothetical protein
MRSAGFEPAIPSLGSSYLNQTGLTSLNLNFKFRIRNNNFVIDISIVEELKEKRDYLMQQEGDLHI